MIVFACGEIPKFPANIALLKEASIVGVWLGTWASHEPGESRRNMAELTAMVDQGDLIPRVTESYPLERFLDAFAAITKRRARGKVVITFS